MEKLLEEKLQQILDAVHAGTEVTKSVHREIQTLLQDVGSMKSLAEAPAGKGGQAVDMVQFSKLFDQVADVVERLEEVTGKPVEVDLLHASRVGTQAFEDEKARCKEIMKNKKHPEYESASERMRKFGWDR